MICSKKMQRYIWLVADDPTIVCSRWNVKQTAGGKCNFGPIRKCRHCATRNYHSDMFNFEKRRSGKRVNIYGPLPARFITCAPNRHSAKFDDFKFALLKMPNFVRRLKPL